jgi:clan AA aspartic protease
LIQGIVNPKLEAVVRLSLRGSRKHLEVEAVVDTGFSGTLVLPSELIEELGLRRRYEGSAILADGSQRFFDVYEALIFWNSRVWRIPVGVMDSAPLMGMSLLRGSELAIQVVEGGEVFIRELDVS